MSKIGSVFRNIYHFPETYKMEKRYKNFINNQSGVDYISRVQKYVESMKENSTTYCFSKSSNTSSIYSSTYGCLLQGLYNGFSEEDKISWKEYFDSHQNEADGLYYDNAYDKDHFFQGGDGWGARHLVPHITIAFDRIGKLPKYEFKYLEKLMHPDDMISWLKELDYVNIWASSNIIMNIGVAMQYSRDRMGLPYGDAIEAMEDFLLKKINRDYGMWYDGIITSSSQRYEMIRGAYHILPLFYYDGIETTDAQNAINEILISQNKWGGFDGFIASSACADIDGLDPLLRFSILQNDRREEVVDAVKKSKEWVLFNQNLDGGFVFERGKKFSYGQQKALSSEVDESNMFATWFRCVSLELIDNYLNQNKPTRLIRTPGYELPL